MSAPFLTLGWSTLADRADAIRVPDLTGIDSGEVEILVCVQGSIAPRRAAPANLPPCARVVEVAGTGVTRSRNASLTHARGRYLMFCDDDIEIVLDQALATARYLARTGRALALGTALDPDGVPRKRYPTSTRRLGLLSAGRAATYEMVVDVAAVRGAGLRFDERFGAGASLPLGDEYIFIADLLRSGLQGDAVPWVLASHPHHSSGHRWGSDADADHRAAVLDRVFGWWSPPMRLAFALKNARRLGSLRRVARLALGTR